MGLQCMPAQRFARAPWFSTSPTLHVVLIGVFLVSQKGTVLEISSRVEARNGMQFQAKWPNSTIDNGERFVVSEV